MTPVPVFNGSMHEARIRVIGLTVLLLAALAMPCQLCAQSRGTVTGSPVLSAGDVCQLIGGAVTLGIGLWHFAVPGLYQWQSYVPDAPQSLVEAVDATNFFFSFSLSLAGAASITMPLLTDAREPFSKYWLWTNVALWTGRVAYQLIKPQGSHSPALQWGMLAAFAVTDALFIFAALDATFP
jgi:hypothetical protein